MNTAVTAQNLLTAAAGETCNLSLGGCFIRTSPAFAALPIPSRLSLQFHLPGIAEPAVVFGEVIHTGRHDEGFGVQFKVVHKKAAWYIETYIGTFL